MTQTGSTEHRHRTPLSSSGWRVPIGIISIVWLTDLFLFTWVACTAYCAAIFGTSSWWPAHGRHSGARGRGRLG